MNIDKAKDTPALMILKKPQIEDKEEEFTEVTVRGQV